MRRMVIISPDPEGARMLALAFDLHGWEVGLAADLQQLQHLPRRKDAELNLIDLVDASAARQPGLRREAVAGRLIVIAPHGMSGEEAQRRYGFADRIVQRPYELMSLVKLAEEPPVLPPRPPRTSPKWKKPARRAAKTTKKARTQKPQKKSAKTKTPPRRRKETPKKPTLSKKPPRHHR